MYKILSMSLLFICLAAEAGRRDVIIVYTKQQEHDLVKQQATEYIADNEGKVLKSNRHVLYDDHDGKPLLTGARIKAIPTIGYGRNVMERGLSEDEARYLLGNDIEECMQDLEATFPWYTSLDIEDKVVMVDLRFNLGMDGLKTFKKFLDAMEHNNKPVAKRELLDSAYAHQTGPRARKNADIVGR